VRRFQHMGVRRALDGDRSGNAVTTTLSRRSLRADVDGSDKGDDPDVLDGFNETGLIA
jgi:hypothetical protein